MKYELVVLLNQEAELEPVKNLVTTLKGKIEKEEKWGEKTLAYPISKNYRALFFSLTLEIDAKNSGELRKKLNFNDKILRFLLLAVDSK